MVLERFGEFDAPVAKKRALFEQRLHDLFHEERVALRLLDDHALERRQLAAVIEQRHQHLVATLHAERVEAELRVVGLVAPVVGELRPVIHQQHDPRSANRIGEQVQQRARSVVEPVQVLEDHDERLVQAFAQQQALDRVERAAPSGFGVNAGELIVVFRHLEQGEDIAAGCLPARDPGSGSFRRSSRGACARRHPE